MKPVPIVINPIAGGGRLLRQRVALDGVARANGVDLRWLQPRGVATAKLARGATRRGARWCWRTAATVPTTRWRAARGECHRDGGAAGRNDLGVGLRAGCTTARTAGLGALLAVTIGRCDREDESWRPVPAHVSAGPDAIVVHNLPDGSSGWGDVARGSSSGTRVARRAVAETDGHDRDMTSREAGRSSETPVATVGPTTPPGPTHSRITWRSCAAWSRRRARFLLPWDSARLARQAP